MDAQPLLMANFMATDGEDQPLYAEILGYDALRATLNTKLLEYNESNANMDLVLFQQVDSFIMTIANGAWMMTIIKPHIQITLTFPAICVSAS